MNLHKHTAYLLLAAAAMTMNACAPVLVGGAAAGGYYVGKDERSVGRIADDAAITSKVKTRYVRDDTVKALDINVDTYNGVVTLYGSVPSQRVANRAIELARTTEGVRRVVSRLHILD